MRGGGGKASSRVARHLRLATLDLPYPDSPADVVANLRRVAAALGEPARADPWGLRLAALAASAPPLRDTIFLSGRGDSVVADSLASRWMALAGFRQRRLAGGRATLETLAVHPPRVLLRSDYRHAQVSLGQRWLKHPLATRHSSKTIDTVGRRWTCAGPLMLDEIERLRGVR
jgi:iron complex transport system substrate-binding protein